MAKPSDFQLDAEEIVSAAVDIFREQGLDAVSMRSVAARLGVSPVPLYSRVGNKDALIGAIADHLLVDLVPDPADGEPWTVYARRWAAQLRDRLRLAHDQRLILVTDRAAYVEASKPLVAAMREAGFADDAAVQACRLIMWATIGFVAMERGAAAPPPRPGRRLRSGGDPDGVDAAEADELFAMQLRYLIDGIARDAAPDRQNTGKRGTKR
jgi:TetR/AcrR family tetracycline transcriptional repressor